MAIPPSAHAVAATPLSTLVTACPYRIAHVAYTRYQMFRKLFGKLCSRPISQPVMLCQ